MERFEFKELTVGKLKKLLTDMKDDAVVTTDFQNWRGEWESKPIKKVDIFENSIELNL